MALRKTEGRALERPAADDGPFAFQIAPPSAVRRRRFILFLLLGLFTYLLALFATLPARFLIGDAQDSGIVLASAGTIWSGEAALREGHGLRWRWAPLDTMVNLSFTVNLAIVGPETDLTGQASWRPGGLALRNIAGDASGSLISALAPRLPFTCDFLMRVNIDRIVVRGQQQGIEGEMRSSAGNCAMRADPAMQSPVPPLIGSSTITPAGSRGTIATQINRTVPLVTSQILPNGAVAVTLTARGAALLPPGTPLGAMTYETAW